MKKFLQSIMFLALIFSPNICIAEEKIVLDTSEAADDVENEMTFPNTVINYWEIGKYFEEAYPGKEIEKDFSEDVAKIFPNLSQQEVYDREETIRYLIRLYRYGKASYESIKANLLIPEEPPLVVSEEEYDIPQEREYIKSDDLVVVNDFKKVLSYGGNIRDFKAYKAKYEQERAQEAHTTNFAKLNSLLKKLEWKKILFYGVVYEDPFTGKQGTGKWIKADKAEMRLISENSTIDNKQSFRGGIHFDIERNYFVLAQNYQTYKKPTFSFAGSKNLATASYEYPVPLRLSSEDGNTAAVWKENFMIPLSLEVKDITQPLELKVSADFTVCSREFVCKPEHIDAELILESGEGFYSAVNNFIIQSFNRLPQEQTSDFSLQKAVVDEMKNGNQVLRLEFKTNDTLNNFDVYVENEENIIFERPRVSVGDFGITARLYPQDKSQQLIDKNYIITARLNDKTFLRKELKVGEASAFDYQIGSITLALLFMAVLGGFLLNFMPCVFPVLSIKLLSLTRFGATRTEKLRSNFAFTVGGIFASFEIIALILTLVKLGGQSIGWGMQFQNPVFLLIMIFAITIFMAVVWNWLGVYQPHWLEEKIAPEADKMNISHFLTGALAVLMSTPCTAPYLGTAVGFALGGNILDIWLILNAVSLGLSLPYILVYTFPSLVDFMPKPGMWMERLNKLMGFMLFLTLVWLLSIFYAQAGLWPTVRVIIYVIIFLFIIYYRRLMLDALDETDFEAEVKERVSCWYRRSIFSVLLFVGVFAIIDATHSFNKEQEERTATKASIIDYDLIASKVKEGKNVVVAVGADWCLTCKYNDAVVFNNAIIENLLKNSNTELIEVDWTSYNQEVLEFMKKFGRQGLPFYVVFSPMVPDGMVLPEVLSERGLSTILKSISD